MLREGNSPPQMSKGADDIARDFYLPCMASAVRYDRVAGYFTSGAFLVAWPALRQFVERGGRIRLICSPALTQADVDGLVLGYAARDEVELAAELIKELHTALADGRLSRPARALAGLVADGIIDVRIAFLNVDAPAGTKRIFHDKVGVFRDTRGDRVGFRGTMNETYLGLAADGNLDSIDIFPSWVGGRDAERLVDAETRFEALWANEVPYARVVPFPAVARRELERIAAETPWELIADELAAGSSEKEVPPGDNGGRRKLRDHQKAGLDAWLSAGRRGILEHATGSGKTTTALAAARASLQVPEPVLILVPSEILLAQWEREITEQLGDLSPGILLCGAGHDEWRTDNVLRPWLRHGLEEPRIVVAVVNTASSLDFLSRVRGTPRLLVIADEVHRLGSPTFGKVLGIDASARLGLSATVIRAGDAQGTSQVLEYFGGVVHSYTLADAIRDRLLTPYIYSPHSVELDAAEEAEWTTMTERLRRRFARAAAGGTADDALADDGVKMLLIQRARIAKGAAGKVGLARQVLAEHLHPGEQWLVYCDNRAQLGNVRDGLRAEGIESIEYHSAMEGDHRASLREFDVNGGVVVAIHCLDEGVDIPSASHTLILASSRNPREFIQRRGRVLRLHRDKPLAHVHDALVVPGAHTSSSQELFSGMIWGELARAAEFARTASNPDAATRLERICIELGLDVERLAELGFEDDAPDETEGYAVERV
jgi:superfamily II DNA or RNA helicase